MAKLHLSQSLYQAVIDHAKAHAPLEACGYLAGTTDEKGIQISTFMPMTNVDKSPEHFSFDPKEQFAALKQVRQTGEHLLVVYHSHPETPPRLSAEDVRLFNDPNTVYLIVSLMADPDMKAYTVRKHADVVEIGRVDIVVG